MTIQTDDQTRLTEIVECHDPDRLARLMFDYYHDADRADRTSRSQMYLHLGMLSGAILRVVDDRRPRFFQKGR